MPNLSNKVVYFSLILPIYNEGPILEENIGLIVKQLSKIKKNWEIIFVEDKSTDGSDKLLKRLLPQLKNSKTIFHSKNQGRGQAVKDGILSAKGDICGFLDIDLEVSEKYIPEFIKKIESGFDLVVAKREYQDGKALQRVIASKGYKLLVRSLLKLPLSDTESGYKFFNRKKILPVLKQTQDKGWFWDTEICALAVLNNLKLGDIPVLFIRKTHKQSTVRLIPDTIDYLKKILEFRRKIKLYETTT